MVGPFESWTQKSLIFRCFQYRVSDIWIPTVLLFDDTTGFLDGTMVFLKTTNVASL